MKRGQWLCTNKSQMFKPCGTLIPIVTSKQTEAYSNLLTNQNTCLRLQSKQRRLYSFSTYFCYCRIISGYCFRMASESVLASRDTLVRYSNPVVVSKHEEKPHSPMVSFYKTMSSLGLVKTTPEISKYFLLM